MTLLLASLAALAADPTGPTCAGPLPLGLDAPRPELSGPVQTRDVDPLFRMHFTDTGVDAVPDELLDWAAAEWLEVRATIADSPWRPFTEDDGTGGSPALDAYFVDIDANGFANAVTPAEGQDGHACFIGLNPEIARLGQATARSIVRHELYHCTQFRYTADAHSWVYESHATLEQYRPAPAEDSLRLLTNALWAERITQPERPLDDLGTGLVRFEYAGFIWFKHLEEERVPPWAVWEALEQTPGWRRGLDQALDGGLAEQVLVHAWKNQHVCGREGTVQAYDPQVAGCTAPVEAPRERAEGDTLDVPTMQPWTTRTFEVPRPPGEDPVQLQVACEGSGFLGVLVDNGADSVVVDVEGRGTLSGAGAVAPGGHALVVVAALGTEPSAGSCALDWMAAASPDPEPTGGCASVPGPLWLGLPWLLMAARRRTS